METVENLWQSTLLPLLTDQRYLVGFSIISALLLTAQLFNHFRCSSPAATHTDQKVKVIIASWWRILVFVFFAFCGGRCTMIPVFYLLTLFAIREYLAISALRDNAKPIFAGAALGTTLHYASFLLPSPFLFFTSIHLYVLLVLMPFIVFSRRPERFPELIAIYVGMMILAVFLSFPVASVVFLSDWVGTESQARLAVLLLIVLTEVNDIAQFISGKLFGRHHIVEWVSPSKTEAGFIGGLIFSTALGAALWPTLLPISVKEAALLSALLSLGGMLGDLVCSALKRHRGVKDFSSLIPGHGGVIDRLDSLLVTAPVFFFFLFFVRIVNQ